DLFNLTRSTIDDEMKLVNYANDIAHKHTVIIASAGVSTTSNATIVASEEKYVLLRDFSRLDDRTSQRADYIEWLYSDEDEHRQEIDELWQKRQQRLINKKQK
ncbi:MAG: hypothetical protein SOZ58_06360, partial [Prevotella sp.]|nr:hypothetical protein [Prevotella sp.]